MQKLSISVIGLGGVGGYFGFKLAQKYKIDEVVEVSFVARGTTYSVVAEKGLTLLSPEHEDSICHPAHLAEHISDLPPTDVFILCVKEYDLENVCHILQERINENTVILPLMNGADIYERIRKIITSGIVLPACVYVASHIKEKGVVEHKGKPGKIIMGKDPKHPAYEPANLYQTMRNAGINIEYTENAFPEIWTKYLFIASFGLVSACYNKPIGQVIVEPDMHKKASEIMHEIFRLAEKKGIRLPDDIIETTFKRAATFPYHTPTSLQLDVQSGKEHNELDIFAGTIIRLGEAYGIPVPATKAIYQQLKDLTTQSTY